MVPPKDNGRHLDILAVVEHHHSDPCVERGTLVAPDAQRRVRERLLGKGVHTEVPVLGKAAVEAGRCEVVPHGLDARLEFFAALGQPYLKRWSTRSAYVSQSVRKLALLTIWKGLGIGYCSTSTRVLCLLDPVRHLDHQIRICQAGVVGSDFGHGFIGCSLDLLFVSIFDVLMKRTLAFGFAEVVVVSHIRGADIAAIKLAYHRLQTRISIYHCTFLQCVHVILLHPSSLMNGCFHLLQCRIKASDIASSTM